MEYGIDVSYHNGGINWPAVAANGISFATIKATSGEASGGTDSPAYFRAQAPAMAKHIPLCGGYHWLKPMTQTPAKVQVQTFIDVMQQGLGGHDGRLVQLDVEEGQPSDVRAWLAEWNRVTDSYPVALYLPDWLENQWGANRIGEFGCAAWWSSEYVPGQSLPYKTLADRVTSANWHPQDGVPAAVLQYTSQATVGGVGGKCDVNVYRGTLAALTALLTRGDDMTPQELMDYEVPSPALGPQKVGELLKQGMVANRGLSAVRVDIAGLDTRLAGLTAAVTAVLEAGGSPDSAAILARIDEQAAASRSQVASLQADLDATQARAAELAAQLAAALGS